MAARVHGAKVRGRRRGAGVIRASRDVRTRAPIEETVIINRAWLDWRERLAEWRPHDCE